MAEKETDSGTPKHTCEGRGSIGCPGCNEELAKEADEAFDRRARDLLTEEQKSPLGWWWLSFAGPEGFRGACIVKARGMLGAVAEAHRLGCNPGGEVRGAGPMSLDAPIQQGWTERLLTREEAEKFDLEHMKVKRPEFVKHGNQVGVKVYLCRECAAKLRELATKAHGVLRQIDMRVLCDECQKTAARGPSN